MPEVMQRRNAEGDVFINNSGKPTIRANLEINFFALNAIDYKRGP